MSEEYPDVTKYDFDIMKYPQLKIGTPTHTHTRDELVEMMVKGVRDHYYGVPDSNISLQGEQWAALNALIAAGVVTVRGE